VTLPKRGVTILESSSALAAGRRSSPTFSTVSIATRPHHMAVVGLSYTPQTSQGLQYEYPMFYLPTSPQLFGPLALALTRHSVTTAVATSIPYMVAISRMLSKAFRTHHGTTGPAETRVHLLSVPRHVDLIASRTPSPSLANILSFLVMMGSRSMFRSLQTSAACFWRGITSTQHIKTT